MTLFMCFFTQLNPTVSQKSLWISTIVSKQVKGNLSEQTHAPRSLCTAWPAINQKDFPCLAFSGSSVTEVREEFAAHSHHG